MIVEDQLDRRVSRIGGIDKFEEFDEFAAAVAVPDEGVNLAGEQVNAGQQADRAVALVFMIARKGRMHAGLGAAGLVPWWPAPGYRASRHRKVSPPHCRVFVWPQPRSA